MIAMSLVVVSENIVDQTYDNHRSDSVPFITGFIKNDFMMTLYKKCSLQDEYLDHTYCVNKPN